MKHKVNKNDHLRNINSYSNNEKKHQVNWQSISAQYVDEVILQTKVIFQYNQFLVPAS